MIGFNALSIGEAYAAIDHDTIILLFGVLPGRRQSGRPGVECSPIHLFEGSAA
ncbi:MAG: hypothetical protein ACM336_13955 [Acidobacteriota bacterium]